MASPPLPSPEVLRQLLRYEPETGRLFWKERPSSMFPSKRASKIWNSRQKGAEAFATIHPCGYRRGQINRRCLLAHRVIWAMERGSWPSAIIDHVNGDKTDNRIINLREATYSQNGMNRGPARNNRCGLKGVRKDKRSERWIAQIKVHGKITWLGSFADAVTASAAYEAAAHRLHGEFARTA